jgi:uncharacterized membrane protein YciS (DUF1049 family)
MRTFYLLLLVVFIAAVVIFALQNNEDITLRYINESQTLPLAAVIGGVYLLGMLSGWTIVGFVRRSIHGMTAQRDR